MTHLPLAVDLDGTLIRTDALHEAFLAMCIRRPHRVPLALLAWREGRAAVKRAIADIAKFDASVLPYNTELLGWLRAQKAEGRRIGLFTAADQSVADAVAGHLGLFEVAVGSDGIVNRSGLAKVEAIKAAFGQRFVYAGNGRSDLPVFAAAEQVVLAGPVKWLLTILPFNTRVEMAFEHQRALPGVWIRKAFASAP